MSENRYQKHGAKVLLSLSNSSQHRGICNYTEKYNAKFNPAAPKNLQSDFLLQSIPESDQFLHLSAANDFSHRPEKCAFKCYNVFSLQDSCEKCMERKST